MKIGLMKNKRSKKRDTTTPFTYRITCIITGDKYYGVKYAGGCHPDDLWTTYFTSSKYIKALIDKYGVESFIIEIRKIFDSVEEAKSWEQRVNRKVMNWPNYLNDQCGTAFSREASIRGSKNYAKNNPGKRSENLQKGKDKAHKYLRENKLGYYNPEVQSKGGKIGSAKLKEHGYFQSEKWRDASSRADYIWYTNGKENTRVHIDETARFELENPIWKKGIVRENLQVPDNRGRIYLYSPDEKIKKFVHPNSDKYFELIAQDYFRKDAEYFKWKKYKEKLYKNNPNAI